MDATDFRILASLHRDARASYDALGKEIGMSGNAVKNRIQGLRDEGVLRGFAAVPDGGALGLHEALLRFEHVDNLAWREAEIIRGAPDIGRVSHADLGVDGSVTLHAYFRDEDDFERIERAAANLVGKPPTTVRKLLSDHDDEAPSLLDWRIIRALQSDGRKTLSRLTEDAGVTYKTLRKHLESLEKNGTLRVRPIVSPSEAHGLAMYELTLFLNEEGDLGDVLACLPDDAIVLRTPATDVVRVYGHRDNLRAAQDDFHRVRVADGVEDAWFSVATRHPFPDVLGPTLDNRIASLERTRLEESHVEMVSPMARN